MNEHIMQFFAHDHLPPHLQEVSWPFGELAQKIVDTIPRNPERTVALRKLLEAKDAAVRAVLAKDVQSIRAADGRWICGTCKGSGKAVESINGVGLVAWCKLCGGDGTVHDESKALRGSP